MWMIQLVLKQYTIYVNCPFNLSWTPVGKTEKSVPHACHPIRWHFTDVLPSKFSKKLGCCLGIQSLYKVEVGHSSQPSLFNLRIFWYKFLWEDISMSPRQAYCSQLTFIIHGEREFQFLMKTNLSPERTGHE